MENNGNDNETGSKRKRLLEIEDGESPVKKKRKLSELPENTKSCLKGGKKVLLVEKKTFRRIEKDKESQKHPDEEIVNRTKEKCTKCGIECTQESKILDNEVSAWKCIICSKLFCLGCLISHSKNSKCK